MKERDKKKERNPQTDGECMIDEPCKAIHLILGAVLDRLKLAPLH